jgi:hypothetical protein
VQVGEKFVVSQICMTDCWEHLDTGNNFIKYRILELGRWCLPISVPISSPECECKVER